MRGFQKTTGFRFSFSFFIFRFPFFSFQFDLYSVFCILSFTTNFTSTTKKCLLAIQHTEHIKKDLKDHVV